MSVMLRVDRGASVDKEEWILFGIFTSYFIFILFWLVLVDEEITDQEAEEMIKLFSQGGSSLMTKEEFKAVQKMEMDV